MKTYGPPDAPIVILTDYPSSAERASQIPLSDYAGTLFFEIFTKKGLLRSNVLVISLLDEAPPDDDIEEWLSKRKTCPGPDWRHVNGKWVHPTLGAALERAGRLLEGAQPRLVITLGEAALWALTGNTATPKWRGSRLSPPQWSFPILPMIHPRAMVKDPAAKVNFTIDIARAKKIYEGTQVPRDYQFTVKPSLDQVVETLNALIAKADEAEGYLYLAGDLETRAGNIACLGIAWSATEAICIPFITTNDEKPFYWTEDEEAGIVRLIAELFMHPKVVSLGQNYLYDCQYFWWRWGFLPSNVRDTMILHHSIFSNLRKGLDFLSSMYAHDHIYWKDEIKEWDPKIGEVQYWNYNCKDACITWEIFFEISASVEAQGISQHSTFQQELFFPVLRVMNRGIRINTALRDQYSKELTKIGVIRQEQLSDLVGHDLNPKSPAQLQKLFYEDLGIPGVKNLLTDGLTTNSPAMLLISQREPMLKPLCQLIVELRSIGVFLSTFIEAKLDEDGRMRCSFSIAGPITYRFASSRNAFDSGMNLQNIPVAVKQKIKDKNYVELPNIRKLFIPDEGFTFFDMDLDRADLQVVVWEADDSEMKLALREGLDMHCVNACDVFDIKGIPYDELRESHPNYKDHRGRIGEANRGKTKAGVHATNYGVGDRKLAETLGITVHEASQFRSKWFAKHPGVKRWHSRTEAGINSRGYIENKFGARLYNFGRPNLPEFLGWLPQSTVAGVINRALLNIDRAQQEGRTNVQLLLQVHDSLAGQFPTKELDVSIATLRELSRIPIPYDDPLIIPVGFKTSSASWGDCC